jgi:hypothetical protein
VVDPVVQVDFARLASGRLLHEEFDDFFHGCCRCGGDEDAGGVLDDDLEAGCLAMAARGNAITCGVLFGDCWNRFHMFHSGPTCTALQRGASTEFKVCVLPEIGETCRMPFGHRN